MKTAVVLVTYNRIELLKKALETYENQTRLPDFLVVVDNASGDGTGAFLDEWKKTGDIPKTVLKLSKNMGGAGGYAAGIEYASDLDCDFIFIADDDAFAKQDMIEKAMSFYEKLPDRDKAETAALCTAVYSGDVIAAEHRRVTVRSFLNIYHKDAPKKLYEQESFEIDELSFVGSFLKKDAVKKAGLPLKEYFISYDDTEYSLRLGKFGIIRCVPGSVMYHDTPPGDGRISWRNYYVQRNCLDLIKRHYPKRYYYFKVAADYLRRTTFISALVKGRNSGERELFRDAITDSLHDNISVSSRYRPG